MADQATDRPTNPQRTDRQTEVSLPISLISLVNKIKEATFV